MKKRNFLLGTIIQIYSILCFIPMVFVFIISITDEKMIQKNGYSLLPAKLSLDAYTTLFKSGDGLWSSYIVTIAVAVVGTILALLITAMAAYTLANKKVGGRTFLAFFFFFTTLFNGGIVPWYIICNSLGLRDNIWALIVPTLLLNCFNLFLVRNFISNIPESIMEAAYIDGAGDFRIAFGIYFPLCKPVLAAIALFYGLAYWNDWWNAIMLIDNQKLFPLQYYLFKIQSDIQMLKDLQSYGQSLEVTLPTESLKMATVIVTIGPIALLYPYLQKYFIKGLIIGSVKG